jgi:cyanate permease
MIWVLLGALGNYIAGGFGLTAAQKGLMTAIPLLAGSIFASGPGNTGGHHRREERRD